MVYGDVEFPSVDYFCSSIRNDFLNEIDLRVNSMKHILDNTMTYFVDSNQEKFIRDTLEKKITEKNKDIVDFFIVFTDRLSKKIEKTRPFSEERIEILKKFCDGLVKNKDILRNFSSINDSFIDMMLRFSKEKEWGLDLSFYYFSRYFSSD